jgi:hypothetical protein
MRTPLLLLCTFLVALVALSACSSTAVSVATATVPAAAAATLTATSTTAATVTATVIATAATKGPPGAISGDQLMYPADSMPALEIYAISTIDSHTYFSTQTAQGQFSYAITGVAPGTYYIVAYLANGTNANANWKVLAGGYTQFVLCDLGATCSDHTLIVVPVQPGQMVRHINPNDYYGGTYPPRPGA